ncbi:MAG TPA: cellulose binding domain-containing protein [Puia sp.]|nr:cellulose binding domain-containing protein [Puia sp.]
MNARLSYIFLVWMLSCGVTQTQAQTFVHPGGLHTLADLDRMKAKVAAAAHPWIDAWNVLITDWEAQNTYTALPYTNIGGSGNRQRASQDAHAAYLNTLRWYITGDTTYAQCAVRICNAWSNTVNQVASGELYQLPINNFMQVAELLRIYPGWKPADIASFKNMALTYFYPACHNSLAQCGLPSSWDSPLASSIMGIGVFCDDSAKYNEAVTYFKTGAGNGSLLHAVLLASGQITEMGRDMVHANIGLSCLAEMCQTAWNQGLDLYSYGNNRLLAGFEYYCQYNLNHPVTWAPINDCDNDNFLGISYYNARGYLTNNPTFEMVYNHYNVLQGLSTPYTKALVNLARPETQNADFFGYGTFAYTLDAAASPFVPYPIPAAPTALTARAAVSKVYLAWTGPGGDVANGYNILRSTTPGGPYTSIGSWTNNTLTTYTDWAVTNGTTYYYKVSANNQSGTSGASGEASAQPVATTAVLPAGWTTKDIGSTTAVGSTGYDSVINNTFVVNGSGTGMGGTSDNFTYTYGVATGDFTITVHMANYNWAWTGDKAGLVLRETLNPDAKSLTLYQGDLGNRVTSFQTRNTTGGSTTSVGGNKFSFFPWYRLQRSGNTFTASQSTDGINYGVVGTSTVAMNSTCYVGMGVATGATGNLSNVTYENVTISGGTTAPPSPPTGLTAVVGNTQLHLSWDTTSGAASYTLKRATVSGGPYTTVVTGIDSTSYTDTGRVNGTTYYYVVTAANFAGESQNSAEVSATPVLSLAPVPVGVTAASVSPSQINLSWTSSLSAATYNVKRATASGGPYTTIANPATTSYSDTALVDTTTYYYVISAVNAIGETANSAQVSATPGEAYYWKFDETSGATAVDSWNGKNATLSSGATFTAGAINNGVSLDGTANGYVTLPAALVSSLNDFTVSAWVKLDVNATWGRIFDFGSGTGTYMFLTTKNGTDGTPRYAITTGSGEQGVNGSAAMPTGVWTHMAVTQSGTVAILYVNGVEVGRNTNITLRPSGLGNTTQNWIGKSQWNDPTLSGKVDEFRIYSRALSAAEISNLAFLLLPPATPANLSATAGNNQVTLNWTAAAGGTSYNINRATAIGGPYTIIANATTTSYTDAAATNCTNYFYTVSAVNNVGVSIASLPAGTSLGRKLTGTLIGTAGSWGNNPATTRAAAVDGDLTTFFDASQGSAWVGYDLSADSISVIRRVRYAPRSDIPSRMVGGVFQGANMADFSDAVTLFTVTAQPAVGVLTEQTISDSIPYRYVRYLSTASGYGNVAEIAFFGLIAHLPVFSSDSVVNATYDSAFRYTAIASNMPTQFTATGLPDSLSINTCTGIISGTPVLAGTFPVNITATNFYGASTDTVKLIIKRNQTISFNSLNKKWMGDPDYTLTATASSGLPITYTSADTTVATIVSGKLHIVDTGTTIITASQAGDSTDKAATPVTQTFTVIPLHLQVQHLDGSNGITSTNSIESHLKIVNVDSIGIRYNELTARYWFTAENYAGINTWIDYAQVGNSHVSIKYVQLSQPHSGALGYIEYSFDSSAGTLPAGSNPGEIQSRFANMDWSVMNQADDYSYQNDPVYTLNNQITLYRNGMLIWGTEPVSVPAVLSLKPYFQNQNSNPATNTISTYLYLNNEGNLPVAYQDLSARYWFTKDGSAALNDWIDYAKLGSSNIAGQFVPLSPARDSADTYFEIKVDSSAGTLYPLSSTGNIQYRIAKTDWSNFSETNDYSYRPAGPFAVNPHITIYYKGALVYGTEPTSITGTGQATTLRQQTTGNLITPAAAAILYPNPVTGNSFYIKTSPDLKNTIVQIKMYNANGKMILNKATQTDDSGIVKVEWSGSISPGVYMVQLNNLLMIKVMIQGN